MNKTLPPHLTGNAIRQAYMDFFVEKCGHTFVPSASLVPGGDATLLFTNAGMVQFKDVFLGTDKRPYTRAVDSQKCMRVAGKHNDLDDVGRDDTHHTFFEMLGNWSFGDYYKKEAIAWAWQLLTEVWRLPKEHLWTTCFRDDKGNVPTDEEAAGFWRAQPGINPEHVLFFGRKDNFWEMAETGPCGPCSEIHLDRGPEYCNLQGLPHACSVNGDCARFLELWNLVFIQYNRSGPDSLEPLPATHVDTGMGFERIVSVLQGVDSNYRTDLLWPLIEATQSLTGHSDAEREANFTPYRVIADHARTAAFLIADGVAPGNTGRNYVCRMIIRRAARFGSKIGLEQPFLARVAEKVIENYGGFYPELVRHRVGILDSLTREEKRFRRTVEGGVARLEQIIRDILADSSSADVPAVELPEHRMGAPLPRRDVIPGDQAFDLYATYGLPLEITRDIAREQGLTVDESGFLAALDEHRLASGAGEAFGELGGEDVDLYAHLLAELQTKGWLGPDGVAYDPYSSLEVQGNILALVVAGQTVQSVKEGDKVEVILPKTCFYVESGGQVSDTGIITPPGPPHRELQRWGGEEGGGWHIRVTDVRKPAAGIIVHVGEVRRGTVRVGDAAGARVDAERRRDILRNHTATHLLHAALREVLGEHARQAGSLVAPDRLRFDFNHPEAVSPQQLEEIERRVNEWILTNHALHITFKPLQQAISEGATALFGEKYGETVRNITIGDPLSSSSTAGQQGVFSNELCGGTHCAETGDVGVFLVVSEGSVASGVRRIEAVTGRGAYALVQRRFRLLSETAALLDSGAEQSPAKVRTLLADLSEAHKQIAALRRDLATAEFIRHLEMVPSVAGVPVLTATLAAADADTLRAMTDRFRQRHPSGVAVLAALTDGKPLLVVSVSDDLVKRGLHAGELAKFIAAPLGGSGGGRPTLAQAGGKEAGRLEEALASVKEWVEKKLK